MNIYIRSQVRFFAHRSKFTSANKYSSKTAATRRLTQRNLRMGPMQASSKSSCVSESASEIFRASSACLSPIAKQAGGTAGGKEG